MLRSSCYIKFSKAVWDLECFLKFAQNTHEHKRYRYPSQKAWPFLYHFNKIYYITWNILYLCLDQIIAFFDQMFALFHFSQKQETVPLAFKRSVLGVAF